MSATVTPPIAPPAAAPRTVGGRRAAIDGRWSTTPGRLGLMAIITVIAALAFGAVVEAAELSRSNAADSARTKTEPLLVESVDLYRSLSDANATAATTFLTGGLEPPARRQRYLHDLQLASTALASLARQSGATGAASGAVTTIADQLPIYSGLVETARANNRQGLPVGAAYLRQASALLATTILPAADRLYAAEATRLGQNIGDGTASTPEVIAIVFTLIALIALLVTQRYLMLVSHRVFNVPMAVATVLLVVLGVWMLAGMSSERTDLKNAQHRGSDSLELLSATSVLLSRAEGDESLTLVNRGSDETDPIDYAKVIGELAPPRGLIAQVNALNTLPATLESDFNSYRQTAAQITQLQSQGQLKEATDLATAARTTAVTDRLASELSRGLGFAHSSFDDAAQSAASAVSGLAVAIPLVALVIVGLTLLGIRARLEEYR